MHPYFSIVIPTFNCSDLLQKALTSVFSQTYQNFEVIVVDNSSTDNTKDVLNSFDDKTLRVIRVNNNGIIAHSRNKGIENAKGDWIAFLDSDDVWMPDKLEKVKIAINNNPGVILVSHDEWYVVNGKRKGHLKHGPAGNDIYERLLFNGNCLSTSAVSLKKDIAMESGGFSERDDFITVEDYEYWIRLSQKGKLYFINETLGEWHEHGSNSSNNAQIHADALIAVAEHHLNIWLATFPNSIKQVKQSRAKVYAQAGRIFQKAGFYQKAYRYTRRAIKNRPFYLKAWIIILLSLLNINYPK